MDGVGLSRMPRRVRKYHEWLVHEASVRVHKELHRALANRLSDTLHDLEARIDALQNGYPGKERYAQARPERRAPRSRIESRMPR